MLKPAFSTVACPEWTLDRVANAAGRMGYLGVELRTFDASSRFFANDPALTDPAKVRRLFADAGVSVCSVATDASFDKIVFPPVIGHLLTDEEVQVRKAKRAIDLAAAIDAHFIRVFAFYQSPMDPHKACVARIVERLGKVVDHANKTGVVVVLENGGSFRTAADALEIVAAINSPLLQVCYNAAAASLAGENPAEGAAKLAAQQELGMLRVKDLRDGSPVPLGTGTIPVQPLIAQLARDAATNPGEPDVWCVYEWDRAWLPEIGEPEFALEHAARTIYQWTARAAPAVARQPIPASVY
jgi:sugar phosphate isomerase/epimerase